MLRECREHSPRHCRLAIPTCITAGASRTCRDACRDRQIAITFNVRDGKNIPGIPGAYATLNCLYLVRGQWNRQLMINTGCFDDESALIGATGRSSVKIHWHEHKDSRQKYYRWLINLNNLPVQTMIILTGSQISRVYVNRWNCWRSVQ